MEVDDQRARERRARMAAEGKGAWRDLAGGCDLVAELITERRVQRSSRTPRMPTRMLSPH
jgi:hypothetical protein